MNKVGIIILNLNGKNHLETYLPSVEQYSKEAQIVVVDNDSTDDSVEFLKVNYPHISLIHNESNGGFAKGYNEGLEQIKNQFDYYVLLNSDVEVTENWIEPIIELMDKDSSIAACQPKIKDYNKTLKKCHSTVGVAILNTSITIVFGFSILVLSKFIPTIYFGVFTGIAMLLAMISVLTLLPALILTVKPFGK